MASTKKTLINFDGQTLFKVMEAETYTVPDTITVASPTGTSSGVSGAPFDTKRTAVGGFIYAAFDDVAGPGSLDFQWPIQPGDVIACSAVDGSNNVTVTINGVTVLVIGGVTTDAGVLGYWG